MNEPRYIIEGDWTSERGAWEKWVEGLTALDRVLLADGREGTFVDGDDVDAEVEVDGERFRVAWELLGQPL